MSRRDERGITRHVTEVWRVRHRSVTRGCIVILIRNGRNGVQQRGLVGHLGRGPKINMQCSVASIIVGIGDIVRSEYDVAVRTTDGKTWLLTHFSRITIAIT
jgi:hypothetical protein